MDTMVSAFGNRFLSTTETEFFPEQPEQVGSVSLVDDREARIDTDRPPMTAEQAVGHSVEGPAPHLRRGDIAQQAVGASQHLAGRTTAERQQQNPLRLYALVDEASDTGSQGPGLPAPGAGDHEKWPVTVQHGGELPVVETLGPSCSWRIEHVFDPTLAYAGQREPAPRPYSCRCSRD